SGFVNALLRRFLRERAALCAHIDRSETAATAHPAWLLAELRQQYPDELPSMLAANNETPPMTLRVNPARIPRDQMQQQLAAQDIIAAPGATDTSLVLERAVDVAALPGFAEGLVSVQDAGAQHAALLLDAQPGMRVLDACAAPGGKAGHILEHTPGVHLTAVDVDAVRLDRVADNLRRLALDAELVRADLLAEGWWDGRPYDRILLDVPCSGTGVIRRHPDIKLLRRPGDIEGFARRQGALLTRVAGMLAPGGRLLYATCSVLRAENQGVVDRFLAASSGFIRAQPDMQLLPTPRTAGPGALTDGFYYASLQMKAGA
ncbi:MAG TPA: 16S rRNA (cytosine(967)-C(5))-methyltransferase RsmB, partial [Steroidobacteraceae bacterium]|nr:16S rRNA (cytosine(967)-C(5))-methyltransferase RsmB [Steroidobacteraceae bacterium]